MVQIYEILKVEFVFRKVCYDVLKTSGCELEPDDAQGDIVFAPVFIQVVQWNSRAYMPVAV